VKDRTRGEKAHLDRLSVTSENVDSNDGLVEVGVRALDDVVVEMLLVTESVHSLEDELEEGLQVLRRRRGNEDVGVSVSESSSDGETESGRLSSSSRSGEGDGGGESLLGDGLDEGENGFSLEERRGRRKRKTRQFGKLELQLLPSRVPNPTDARSPP